MNNEIIFYSTDFLKSLSIVPGKMQRKWMDKHRKFYEDLTMTMANESGWELRAPRDFTVEWNGGQNSIDLKVHTDLRDAHLFYTGMGDGICSIRAGYIVKTPPEYAILCSGAPNFFKDGATQLSSLIESNWAHMTFFINWKMTRPGSVTFYKDDPIGFISLVPHRQLENVSICIDTIMADAELYERYQIWNETLMDVDPYREGIKNSETLEKTDMFHVKQRALKFPIDKTK